MASITSKKNLIIYIVSYYDFFMKTCSMYFSYLYLFFRLVDCCMYYILRMLYRSL